jgi:hypothetical protein
MIGIRLLAISTIITGVAFGSSQSAPRFWGKLKPGRYDVGLRVETFLDKGRGDATRGGRPVQITTWYPAAPSKRSVPMSFADYLKLTVEVPPEKTSALQSLRQSLSVAISSEPEGIDDSVLDQILTSKMLAVRDAAPLMNAYPLVLWSARHGTVAAQSVLCEYLASHGYVVAFARYGGPDMPLPYEVNSPEVKLATLKEHVSDLEFALRTLKTLQNVDPTRKVALMSWSYAGESATLVQMQNPDVGLVISLSSNVLNGWVYQGADELSKLDAARLRVPYVIMTERVGTNGTVRTVPAILNNLDSSSYFISFTELAHGNFNATEGMIPSLMGISKVPRWSKSGPAAQLGYETVARYTLRFLNTYLKSSSKKLRPLSGRGWDKGLPAGFVTITRRGANTEKLGN